MNDKLKHAATAFFRWWWNEPGTNTDQGFDEWLAGPGAAYAETSVRVYPDEITPALHDVLRLMNFRTVPIAHALRAGGADIPRKTEEEQAFVLHWMIKLALDHPEDWHKRVGDRLDEIAKAAKASTESSPS